MGFQKKSIKINSFGGPLVWILRKHFSAFTSKIILKYVANQYSDITQKYIEWFLNQEDPPLPNNVMVETINRCNGKCEFCPANSSDEKRPFKKMSDEMFYDIVKQLKKLNWRGKLFMCVNNEPFIDRRIVEFSRYAKNELHTVQIVMITNGTMLTPKRMDELIGIVDQIVINDYSERYRLSDTHKTIYKYVKAHSNAFKNMKITINRRYTKEILATRAGTAPNKSKKNVDIKIPCLYPFTDLVIYPDGKVGMCCNDCFEVTNFGNVSKDGLKEIWGSTVFRKIREDMIGGRNNLFCSECDVLDAGEREREIREHMKGGLIYKDGKIHSG